MFGAMNQSEIQSARAEKEESNQRFTGLLVSSFFSSDLGPKHMNRNINHDDIKGKVALLELSDLTTYINAIMEGMNIDWATLQILVNDPTQTWAKPEEASRPSLSGLLGLGWERTNPGIAMKLANASRNVVGFDPNASSSGSVASKKSSKSAKSGRSIATSRARNKHLSPKKASSGHNRKLSPYRNASSPKRESAVPRNLFGVGNDENIPAVIHTANVATENPFSDDGSLSLRSLAEGLSTVDISTTEDEVELKNSVIILDDTPIEGLAASIAFYRLETEEFVGDAKTRASRVAKQVSFCFVRYALWIPFLI